MKPFAIKTFTFARPLLDCIAILFIWCMVLFAGCSLSGSNMLSSNDKAVEQPRTLTEWVGTPRVNETPQP